MRLIDRSARTRQDEDVQRAVVPPWVAPDEASVREARRRAGGWFDSSGGEARYQGIVWAFDWVAGVRTDAPVTEELDEPTPGRALIEVLAGEQALGREPRSRGTPPWPSALDQERQMERLGRGVHVAAALFANESNRLRDRDIRFLDGAVDTLRWLLGDAKRPPVALPTPDDPA